MAKLTLQQVRAAYGDNHDETVVAFKTAVDAHQRYIQVRCVV